MGSGSPRSSCGLPIWRGDAFVAETPRGGFIVNMEIQPEAPLANAPRERQQLKLGQEGMPS
jgi:hypothetical protein